jgi:hypothetical protein
MGEIRMTKDEMAEGFAQGRTLVQEEWAHPQEIAWVDELAREGKAVAGPWEYRDGFQCERRRITGVQNEKAPPSRG